MLATFEKSMLEMEKMDKLNKEIVPNMPVNKTTSKTEVEKRLFLYFINKSLFCKKKKKSLIFFIVLNIYWKILLIFEVQFKWHIGRLLIKNYIYVIV